MTESKQAPREFYVWPKRKGEFFGSILSIEDFESAINPHCKELSFKAIEYSAYETEKQKVEQLKAELDKAHASWDRDVRALETITVNLRDELDKANERIETLVNVSESLRILKEQFKSENECIHFKLESYVTEFTKQSEALKVLKDMGEFYANKNNWNDRWFESPDGNEDNDGDIYDIINLDDVDIEKDNSMGESWIGHYSYGGKRAREALSKCNEILAVKNVE